ncbi:hypothetical protein L2E82_04499 [Cichorium intybus]|uniref:Uncharacterized protein n=1 Tax=Cichorium intybus TaxID=13427 RepID=A0ACB9H661_CICIN|nr:hypothetical protein L2E82_04499 [Cichorium intybus]
MPPKVINKRVNDKLIEPYEIATVEVPEIHMGSVVELLGKRRGQMVDMKGLGYVIVPISSGETNLIRMIRLLYLSSAIHLRCYSKAATVVAYDVLINIEFTVVIMPEQQKDDNTPESPIVDTLIQG